VPLLSRKEVMRPFPFYILSTAWDSPTGSRTKADYMRCSNKNTKIMWEFLQKKYKRKELRYYRRSLMFKTYIESFSLWFLYRISVIEIRNYWGQFSFPCQKTNDKQNQIDKLSSLTIDDATCTSLVSSIDLTR
jgi:hypothetical protein